jgi:hypothetical protein
MKYGIDFVLSENCYKVRGMPSFLNVTIKNVFPFS